jgi:hypothetical protein
MSTTVFAIWLRGGKWAALVIAGLLVSGPRSLAAAAEAPSSLVDSHVDMTMATGETLINVKIVRVREGTKPPGSLYTVTMIDKATGKQVTVPAARIREVCLPGGKAMLVYDPMRKMLVPPTEASARAGVEEQGDTSTRLRLSDSDQKAAVEKQRAFLLDAGQKVRSRGMQLHETKRFLFYTDVPAQIITSTYVPYLDAMYARLCDIYGIDPNINIWKGKASIVVFVDDANFMNFQRTFFKDPGLERVAGLANLRPGGEVMITARAGTDPKFFASMLVHETTHGFTFRYFAGRSVPSWLHEGISEWIANQVVPACTEVRRRVERSTDAMRRTHRMGSQFFTAQYIEAEQYGTATSFVNFLLMFNPMAAPASRTASRSRRQEPTPTSFRQFQEKLRAGTPWEKSLEEAYGMTLAELIQRYGQSIGVADLQP